MIGISQRLCALITIGVLLFSCSSAAHARSYDYDLDAQALAFDLTGFISLAGFGAGAGQTSVMGHALYAIKVAQVTMLPSGDVIIDGTFTLTNPSRMQLRGTFHQVSARRPNTSEAVLDINYTINGGTGRFNGARGSANAHGTHNLLTGLFTLTASGNIQLRTASARPATSQPKTKRPNL